MKKLLSLFFCLILLLSIACAAAADNRNLTVYIAAGSSSAYRYHKTADCPSLSRSVVASRTLEEAALAGFTACTRCHPPEPDFEVVATPRPNYSGYGTAADQQPDNGNSEKDDFPVLGFAAFAAAYVGIWWLLARRK